MINAFAPPFSSAPGDSSSEGYSGAAARADHKHGREAADANYSGTPTTSAVGDAAAVGTATTGSRSDHRHGREAYETAPAAVGSSASAGTAVTVPHGDHVHALAGLGAWAAFSPAWTSTGTAPAIGNGSISGRYAQFGKTVHFKILLVAGTTTTFGTGTWSFSLPVTNSANTLEQDITGRVNPAGQAYIALGTIFANNATVGVQSVTSQTDTRVTGVDSTHPATWTATSTNVVILSGTYEAA